MDIQQHWWVASELKRLTPELTAVKLLHFAAKDVQLGNDSAFLNTMNWKYFVIDVFSNI